ncbi:MAG: 50S ribosomal protein L30e [Thermoprotei archaeon]|nr:MAG: 50S ribosomal protein L30e [Thermoprotei archaeon]
MVDLYRELQTAMRTGKVIIGFEETMKIIRMGKAKLVIMAANAPDEIREEVERYCKLADIPLYVFQGTSLDLGAICRKPFMVSVLSILDPGESKVLDLAKGE